MPSWVWKKVYIATLGGEACGPRRICLRSCRANSTSASTSTPLLLKSEMNDVEYTMLEGELDLLQGNLQQVLV